LFEQESGRWARRQAGWTAFGAVGSVRTLTNGTVLVTGEIPRQCPWCRRVPVRIRGRRCAPRLGWRARGEAVGSVGSFWVPSPALCRSPWAGSTRACFQLSALGSESEKAWTFRCGKWFGSGAGGGGIMQRILREHIGLCRSVVVVSSRGIRVGGRGCHLQPLQMIVRSCPALSTCEARVSGGNI